MTTTSALLAGCQFTAWNVVPLCFMVAVVTATACYFIYRRRLVEIQREITARWRGELDDEHREHYTAGLLYLDEATEHARRWGMEDVRIAFDPDEVGERERRTREWLRDDRRAARDRPAGGWEG